MICTTCRQSHPANDPCRTWLSHVADVESPESDELVGETVGSFRLVRTLGQGGMGTVYLGEHLVIGSKVAIKVLHRELAMDEEMVRRFHAEARATNLIGHENIVSIFDFGKLSSGRHYLVMEFLEGTPLSDEAMPLPVERAVELLGQMCSAVDAAHRVGVVHRDLKPDNVFVTRRGKRESVKLLDFGVAKLLAGDPSATRTLAGAILGTPEYMAPEQVSGAPVDGRADLYALGIIAYELLTGSVPFAGNWAKVMVAQQSEAPRPLHQVRPELPHAVSDAVLRALAKNPAERYATASELGDALRRALEDRPREAAPPKRRDTAISGVPEVALLTDSTGRRAVRLRELSRVGAYLLLEQRLPKMRERVTLEVQLPGGTLCAQADVIQLVDADLARAWGMPPGAAVQFCESGSAFTSRWESLLSASAGQAAVEKVEALLRAFRSRLNGSLYSLLELPPDAEFSEIRRQTSRALAQLEPHLRDRLPAQLAEQLQGLVDRVNQARVVLGDPVRRAEHDGAIGNFRGVARCLAAGLRVDELAACRRRLLANRAKPVPISDVRLLAARAWEAQGQPEKACEELERALIEDPLHLELHRQHAALRRWLPVRLQEARMTGAA